MAELTTDAAALSYTDGWYVDTRMFGAGNDVFQWDPGDGSDVVEGRDGADKMADAGAVDSFSFGVEREMKESGEKGGTEDAAAPLASVTDMIIDPFDSHRLGELKYNFGGIEGSAGTCHVDDTPMAWDNVKNAPWSGSELDPSGRLFVGTDLGVWRDDADAGHALTAVPDGGGIPIVAVEYLIVY